MTTVSDESRSKRPEDRVIQILEPLVRPLGYEVVHVEIQTHHGKTLRVFIDFADQGEPADSQKLIGIEDCVKVTHALDAPLETSPEIDSLFKGAYELEVSSPGVDRPLRTESDYRRFSGREARVHVFRPLTAEEMENAGYQERNPKQKNFVGELKGVRNGKVLLALNAPSAKSGTPGKKGGAQKGQKGKNAPAATNSAEEVSIPIPLISKANLEPVFGFE